MQNEIIVFTEGDSNDASVWSNIPFFLTQTLEEKGCFVHRVNVDAPPFIIFIYRIFTLLIKTFYHKNTTYTYNRSRLFAFLVNTKMKKALKKYPNSYCTISTSYSFAPYKYTCKPTVLICDWTYDYYFKYFLKRTPDYWERREINRQDNVLENASLIIPLSPNIAGAMESYYSNKNIRYLGSIINCKPFSLSVEHLRDKQNTANIVFIGIKKYIAGALSLIDAIDLLRDKYPNLHLDIIGMCDVDFESLPAYVTTHGYLIKSNPNQLQEYTNLLQNATIYINTTPDWAAPSATLEALYSYVPIITTPYTSIVDLFGSTPAFGYYCDENTPKYIANYMSQILALSSEDYVNLCMNARNCVQEYTWSSYVDKILMEIKKLV